MRRPILEATFVWLVGVGFCACGNAGNAAPSMTPPAGVTVTLTTDGPASCNPVGQPWPSYSCKVTVMAQAKGFEGTLSYSWSGVTAFSPGASGWCDSGGPVAGPSAACRIYSPEQIVVASVTVRDDHGHAATGSMSVTGEGVNHPAAVRLGNPFTLPNGSPTLELYGQFVDPDEPNMCTADHVAGGSVTGDCRPNLAYWSSCLEGGPTVDIYRTATAGTCEVTLKVRDSANLVGTTVLTVRYGSEPPGLFLRPR